MAWPTETFWLDVAKSVIDKVLLAGAGDFIAYRFAMGLERYKARVS